MIDRGLVAAGDLVVGADSHTVTCGALNAFAIGVGSSDLAAAMMTGKIWLRVPETIRVNLRGSRPAGVAAKDVALLLVGESAAMARTIRRLSSPEMRCRRSPSTTGWCFAT